MKKQLIRNLQIGDEVETQALVLECNKGTSLLLIGLENFLKMILGDVSGSIRPYSGIQPGLGAAAKRRCNFVRGEVGDYYGPQVVISDHQT